MVILEAEKEGFRECQWRDQIGFEMERVYRMKSAH